MTNTSQKPMLAESGGIVMARVLIVDDSKSSRALLTGLLTSSGHEVVAEATNGSEGYDACQLLNPDIVTLDVDMPDMDGLTCLKLIRANFPAVKVVMISSASEKTKIFEALDMGASYYILKPFDVHFVAEAIDNVLRGVYPRRFHDSPFSLLSTGSRFDITLTRHFAASHLPALNGAVRAVADKPILLSIHVEQEEAIEPAARTGLMELLRQFRERGGQIELFNPAGKTIDLNKDARP